jgi:hypothetical protein
VGARPVVDPKRGTHKGCPHIEISVVF